MSHPYLRLEHPIRLAHRGSRVLWPENTMVAFQGAVDLGYRYIELDVRATLDDVVVVYHDQTLERVTNGAGRVRDWRYSELLELDAAYHFDPEGGYPSRGRGVRVPTLEEVLHTYPGVHFNIDLKDARIEWLVAEIVRKLDRTGSTLVGSFWDRRTALYRRILGPEAATSAGPASAGAMWAASRIGRTVRLPPVAYQLPFDARVAPIDRKLVDAIHAAGAQLHVWTVNEAGDMRRMLDLGVDGVVTDRPDVLRSVVRDRPASA
ncbi:MAG: glycerophosphodiester phosphodiesterase [Acidimicrobiia bacterium]